MQKLRFFLYGLALYSCPGCDPAAPGVDAGSTDTAGSDVGSAPDVPGLDVPAGTDAPGGTDAGVACTPSAGPATGGAYCDLMELALFTSDDGSPRAELRGRLNPDDLSMGGCAVIDMVEVQVGGATVATLPGVGNFAVEAERALLAEGAAFDALTTRCAGDVNRFGGFGFLVHGRRDGGTFVGECADAEGGGRWPPAVRVTCHHNVEASPFSGYGMVSGSGAFTFSSLDISSQHGPGAALQTVEGTVHIIPGFGPSFGGPPPPMLMPFDSTGWTGTVSESSSPFIGAYSQVHLSSMMALPIELCPPPRTGLPDPGDPLPPVFLVGIRGTSERGGYRTEGYVNYCNTITSP